VAVPLEHRLLAILSADVSGYSRLMAANLRDTVERLGEYRAHIEGEVKAHRGRVVDSPGDNLLAEFPSATDAVQCAIAIQRELGARNTAVAPGQRMDYRIGVHLGEVAVQDGRLYGDGVNVAARLQALAEAGGICVSDVVQVQLRGRLDVELEDLGERQLHNIPGLHRVYRIALEAGSAAPPPAPFHERPAIAVMAFDNLSDDPEQEYLADGIAEDLITRLSALRVFPVIARNSSFVYKGRAVDLKQVGRELGARYVIEGSVRRAGNRVRVTAQLIDTTTGHHISAQRQDRELVDLLALQDEITETLAGQIAPLLDRSEQERAVRLAPQTLGAWELMAQGQWHYSRFTRESNARALALFERACAADPNLAPAHSGRAAAHIWNFIGNWAEDLAVELAAALEAASRSIACDDAYSPGHVALGTVLAAHGRRDQALAELQRALDLDPSNAVGRWRYGATLMYSGRGAEAMEQLQRAIQLSPQDPRMFLLLADLGHAHWVDGRLQEALPWYERSIARNPRHAYVRRPQAACLAELGWDAEARHALQKAEEIDPITSFEHYARLLRTIYTPPLAERFIAGLRRAGGKE
jgi:adenylate cyclase